ncbi:hypothetical protein E4T66_17570 [Sinimarinibacterium sp. CAU 1509]|uniref:DUF7167 family protein n=1 Tax=Sinimarinibacterium sp. CAU 1509 TaxID=2562283 RepID=UPI0010ACC00F|nr:hypothetical protein [Sinimarinibacterium sp. CAU 1509]TJY57218.1 hypothetical protein E4T66_17570 [Sinimarinibacterium sp. CAU 1509]
MPRIKLFVDTGFAECSHTDILEVDDADWEAMSPEERDAFLAEEAREFMGNHIDYGAYVMDDADAASGESE